MKILRQAGYVEFTDEEESSSSVKFAVNKDILYTIKITEEQEQLIHILFTLLYGAFYRVSLYK